LLTGEVDRGVRASKRAPIPFFRPWVDAREIQKVSQSIRSGWLTTGPNVAQFESGVRKLVGARHAVAVNSCTSALHLALIAAGVRRGDEVITSPYTFAATGEVILHLGARPVFADIVPETLNIDPEEVEARVTRRTQVILPVHIAGLPCEMRKLMEIGRRRRIRVVDDAAHALGARIGKRPIGSVSDISCFSFYATKNMTTGEGGMVTTGDGRMADRMRRLSLHGLSHDAWNRYRRGGSWQYDVVEMGYKYNMTDLAAAMGLAQLCKFGTMQRLRRSMGLRYNRGLTACDAFDLPSEPRDSTHAWHLYILRIRPGRLRIGRDRLIETLERRGIGTSVHFIPLHLHTLYRRMFGLRRGAFPRAERESARALSLPLYPGLKRSEQDRVIDVLLDTTKRYRR
jgi:dTDP-4-amino-4,6-dideoxygalactose transaminase